MRYILIVFLVCPHLIFGQGKEELRIIGKDGSKYKAYLSDSIKDPFLVLVNEKGRPFSVNIHDIRKIEISEDRVRGFYFEGNVGWSAGKTNSESSNNP
jgi:hypothetical protein